MDQLFQNYENDIKQFGHDTQRQPNTERRDAEPVEHPRAAREQMFQEENRPIKVFVPLRSRSRSKKNSQDYGSKSSREENGPEGPYAPRNTMGAAMLGSRRSASELAPQINDQRVNQQLGKQSPVVVPEEPTDRAPMNKQKDQRVPKPPMKNNLMQPREVLDNDSRSRSTNSRVDAYEHFLHREQEPKRERPGSKGYMNDSDRFDNKRYDLESRLANESAQLRGKYRE